MSPSLHVTLSLALSMGIPLAWAVRELLVMRADLGGAGRSEPDATPEPRPLPPDLTIKPLPAGLVPPEYVLARVREVEKV